MSDKTMTNVWALYSPWFSVFRNVPFLTHLYLQAVPLVHLLRTRTEIRPYYLRPQAGIVLSLSTLFSALKWAEIETQILFLPIRKRKPGHSQW